MEYNEYKNWLKDINKNNTDNFNLQSDARVKYFINKAVSTDTTLSKMIGLSLLKNGIMNKNLANIYILGKLVRGEI